MIYADWIASGRLYQPIEKKMQEIIHPYCANPHTETSITGTHMTNTYLASKRYIKQQVNAGPDDILIFEGAGMTACISKLQRILGLRIPEQAKTYFDFSPKENKPVVFVTHMEHHSNHTSWLETIADVEIIDPDEHGQVSLQHLQVLLTQYASRTLKIASVTSASNVTGVRTPYYAIAEMMHEAGGYCFVDFACSGPYDRIDMHPPNASQQLDAIFISPHKFLGGPGTPGILVFNTSMYRNQIPDHAGGGTVKFTTPWKFHAYIDNIEEREDGGTPPFLQGIRAALCFQLKQEMDPEKMAIREHELIQKVFTFCKNIPNLHILQDNIQDRVGAISFCVEGLHFNLGVKLLNDRYGIQVRGGCACAGTYGHYLLKINQEQSDKIFEQIRSGDLFARPGWIRLSIHPTMSDADIDYILAAIQDVALHFEEYGKDYFYVKHKNIFRHIQTQDTPTEEFLIQLFETEPSGV